MSNCKTCKHNTVESNPNITPCASCGEGYMYYEPKKDNQLSPESKTDLRIMFRLETGLFYTHQKKEEYIHWLETMVLKAEQREMVINQMVDVSPRCGSEDIITTIYCNKCNQAH